MTQASIFSVALLGLLVSSIVLASKEENRQKNRKVLCDMYSDELYKDLNSCFTLESKVVQEATKECGIKAMPSSNGDVVVLFKAGCKDMSLFDKFDECFSEYEANESFEQEMEIGEETEKCYEDVKLKHSVELSELRHGADH